MKIKKGDKVLIIKGKDKGKQAKVLRGFPESSQVLVENINLKKIHKRPRKEGEKGQIVEVPLPIAIAKVKLVCPKCNQASKVGYKVEKKEKTRFCKKCSAEL